jgi:hypothetical protein
MRTILSNSRVQSLEPILIMITILSDSGEQSLMPPSEGRVGMQGALLLL